MNRTVLLTDRTITSLTGSSQSLMAQNMTRYVVIIENSGADNIGVNLAGGVAAIGGAGTLTLAPGGSIVLDTTAVGNAINVIGTAAQPVCAYEG